MKTKLIEKANKIGIAGNTEGEITDKIKSRWGIDIKTDLGA